CALAKRSFQCACSSGVMKPKYRSFSVKLCRAKGGGKVGKGCVGEVHSPGTSDLGTGRSSIGHTGLPDTRSNTYRKPFLEASATTSTALPSCFTVASCGAAVGS